MFSLENASFSLRVDPSRNVFTVEPRQKNAPVINDVHFAVRYRRGHRWYHQLDKLPAKVSQVMEESSVHGDLRLRNVSYGPNRHGLVFDVCYALPRTQPLLLWKMAIRNIGTGRVEIDRIEMLRAGFSSASQNESRRRGEGRLRGDYVFPLKGARPAFFSNGWGSWNHTGALGFTERFRRTRFRWFNGPMRINPGTPQPRSEGHFASDMFAVLGDREHRGGLLLGFLSQVQHFGSIEALVHPLTRALSMWANGDETHLAPGAEMATDWACLQPVQLDSPDPFAPYMDAVAREAGLDPDRDLHPPVGWCSWYEYFQGISEAIIRENLDQASLVRDRVPLDLIQIDDGWQSQIGDWDSFAPSFPNGVEGLAKEIQEKGFIPGLWLAPFILHPDSELRRKHPDWILKNRFRLPVNAGFVWNRFTRALDISRPEVLDHVVNGLRQAAKEWGYPYLKLDFLYAGALGGCRADTSRTRAQILRAAFTRIREAVGNDVVLLACGCPLGPAIGLFDAMRINADVAPYWYPRFMGHEKIFRPEPDFPAARNAIQNAVTRAPMHQRWWVNDPDCLLIRPESDLSLEEVQSLAAVIGLTGGSVLLSDDMTRLPESRLRIARQMLPPVGKRPQVMDWFDEAMPRRLRLDLRAHGAAWHLIALFNWSDKAADLALDLSEFSLDSSKKWIASEFWRGDVRMLEKGVTEYLNVAPNGCVLLALRQATTAAQYAGSDLHFSQGLEILKLEADNGKLTLWLDTEGRPEGRIILRLPGVPGIEHEVIGDGLYGVPVSSGQIEPLVIPFVR